MSAIRPEKKFSNINQTSFVHHVQLDIRAEDIELIDKLCPATIYDRIIEEMDQKEKLIEGKLNSVESQLWKQFSELMDEDCLNADKPDMFLALKNILNIKIVDCDGNEFSKQVKEAFADLEASV